MRAGGCTVQQALTPEAAHIVKQAVSLARRRGHAQVTPLHVANAMLSSTSSLLRAACLQSHSHPLQCKALELCFNVALNRLPASSSSGPMLGPHHHHQAPSLSNALVAAFKRAQAHQRRGSIETQQQPLLAVKIELEQLIISILDDPSVSRVMREAGFSSTQVKSNVEQAVSLDVSSSPTSSNPNPNPNKPKDNSSSTTTTCTTSSSSSLLTANPVRSEDVGAVIQSLVISKRRTSVVVVGECLTTTEGVVRGVMDRVEKGDVPETLRNLQFITLPLFSFANMCRGEVEKKIVDLRCVVRACCAGRGVVLYLGDLKWAAEYREKTLTIERSSSSYTYCPVEHVTMEIGRLVCGGINNINGVGDHEGSASPRFWLMGVATYQTYMKCRAGQLPLETLWGLQPLIVPAYGSLALSLNYDSNSQKQQMKSKKNGDATSNLWTLVDDGAGDQLNCCTDYSVKFESTDSQSPRSRANISSTSLPSWLQQYKDESKKSETTTTTTTTTTNDQDCNVQLLKWINSTSSHKLHRQHPSEMTIHFASASLSSSSMSSHGHHYSLQKTRHHHQGWPSEAMDECLELTSSSFPHGSITIPNNLNSASSSDIMEMDHLPAGKFKELNAENLKKLCNALERKVSWRKDIIPDIASTILQCRSGMMRRDRTRMHKEDTWLFFQGGDEEGKIRIARELASLVFGSSTNLVTISLSSFSSTRSGSSDDLRNKRSRSQESHSYLEKFFDSVRHNPHRVFLLEDIEQVDYNSQMGIKSAIETGNVQSSCGDDVCVSDAIVVLSCVSFDSRSRACSPPVRHKTESEEEKDDDCEKEVVGSSVCLDLNLCAGEEEEDGGDSFTDDVGLLESVDRSFFFQLPEEYL